MCLIEKEGRGGVVTRGTVAAARIVVVAVVHQHIKSPSSISNQPPDPLGGELVEHAGVVVMPTHL